jgi:sigma-B regulation protein RsbU (phosphoserine phosphatase)
VESLLERIDHSAGDEKMLLEILHLLVESPEASSFGIDSGRLYREEKKLYRLIESIGELGPAIAGKTVSKSYQVVKDIERRRLWVVSPETPGWDPEVEAQFSTLDSAAILIGRDPSYILSLGIKHHGSEEDLRVLLETIRAAVGMKLREQILASQMRQARVIQQSLLPSPLPALEGFDIAAVSHPAEEVGGDVYDVQHVEDGVIGLMVADASGHGLPAALQARDVVIGMRMGQANGEKITATVSRLNRVINNSGLASRFISLFYGEIEQSGNLVYVNGGHCLPLLLTPDNEVFELKSSGPVLGPLPEAVYRRGYVTVKPGEVLVIYTDGVTERHHPDSHEHEAKVKEFGLEGLVATTLKYMDRPAAEIAEKIVAAVRKYGGGLPFDDDVSLLVLKRLTAENYPPVEELTPLAVEVRR